MISNYRVVHYQDRNGNDPIQEFLDSLRIYPKDWAKVNDAIARLEVVGLLLTKTNAAKPFDAQKHLYELKKGNYRVIFLAQGNTFTLLHGFPKHQQKTPREDKTIITSRLEHLLSEEKK